MHPTSVLDLKICSCDNCRRVNLLLALENPFDSQQVETRQIIANKIRNALHNAIMHGSLNTNISYVIYGPDID